MTEATEILSTRAANDSRVTGVVSAAHFVSHYYLIILPPLFAFVRADYGVSYTELGLALTAFNIVSAVLQTPAGFLVDRLGARMLLIGGLALGAAAFAAIAIVNSFWFFVAAFAVAGLANTVYHPADYAMLSQQVSSARISKAYAVHTFAGMLGNSVAPVTLLLMQNYWGWRGAFLGASLLGFAVAAILSFQPDTVSPEAKKPDETKAAPSWSVLLSAPILLNLFFFTMISVLYGGMVNYFVVAIGALHDTPPAFGNTALTAYLLMSAIGVLSGGWLATHFPRHALIAAISLAAAVAVALIIAAFDLGNVALLALMSFGGFFYGLMMPSRDMIVRAVTPPGSFGKVFGFVTTGFNVAGALAPLIFGAMMDHGHPAYVFLTVAAVCLVSVFTVFAKPLRAG